MRTRLFRVEYQEKELLLQFNSRVVLGLSNSLGRLRRQLSIEDEISNKLDLIYGRVQEILDMHLPRNDVSIILLSNEQEVQQVYRSQYITQTGYIDFSSSAKNSIYIAIDKVNIRILAHELAHVVIHHFFQKRPPERVHELLAQYVERQFKVAAKKEMK